MLWIIILYGFAFTVAVLILVSFNLNRPFSYVANLVTSLFILGLKVLANILHLVKI